jgi:hypothetical protein
MKAHAVEKGYLESPRAQEGTEIQKAQRLHPQIIGRKIVNPGVDEKNGSTGEISHGNGLKIDDLAKNQWTDGFDCRGDS